MLFAKKHEPAGLREPSKWDPKTRIDTGIVTIGVADCDFFLTRSLT